MVVLVECDFDFDIGFLLERIEGDVVFLVVEFDVFELGEDVIVVSDYIIDMYKVV